MWLLMTAEPLLAHILLIYWFYWWLVKYLFAVYFSSSLWPIVSFYYFIRWNIKLQKNWQSQDKKNDIWLTITFIERFLERSKYFTVLKPTPRFLPCCRALLKTLISLSCTPIPVLRDTESVALSLLPLFMDPLAWVLVQSKQNNKTEGEVWRLWAIIHYNLSKKWG